MFIPPRPKALVFFALLTLFGVSYLTLDLPTPQRRSSINLTPFHISKDPQVLLVSAFYPLSKSKHTKEEYAKWMTLYLSKIKTHIYFFAPPEIEGMVRKLRGNLPMTLNTTFATPFDIPPLQGMEDRYADMNKVDPENAYHSSELYAVWSSKTYFLREALLNMQSAGMTVEYTFWCDAGSFREKQDFVNWPALERVDEIFTQGANMSSMHKDELFFMPMWDIPKDPLRNWTPPEGPKEYESAISEGQPVSMIKFHQTHPVYPPLQVRSSAVGRASFIGGIKPIGRKLRYPRSTRTMTKSNGDRSYHDYYIFKLNKFAGKDQVVFNGLFLIYPKRFITVWLSDWEYEAYKHSPEGSLGECGGTWWYYQFFFASDSEREHMRRIWTPSYRTSPKFPDRPPAIDGEESKACRMSRVLWMDDLMRRKWGSEWQPPHTPVDTDVSYRD